MFVVDCGLSFCFSFTVLAYYRVLVMLIVEDHKVTHGCLNPLHLVPSGYLSHLQYTTSHNIYMYKFVLNSLNTKYIYGAP